MANWAQKEHRKTILNKIIQNQTNLTKQHHATPSTKFPQKPNKLAKACQSISKPIYHLGRSRSPVSYWPYSKPRRKFIMEDIILKLIFLLFTLKLNHVFHLIAMCFCHTVWRPFSFHIFRSLCLCTGGRFRAGTLCLCLQSLYRSLVVGHCLSLDRKDISSIGQHPLPLADLHRPTNPSGIGCWQGNLLFLMKQEPIVILLEGIAAVVKVRIGRCLFVFFVGLREYGFVHLADKAPTQPSFMVESENKAVYWTWQTPQTTSFQQVL